MSAPTDAHAPPASTPRRLARARLPLVVFLVSAAVYVATTGPRLLGPSPDNHFVHLALSFLDGQLGVLDNHPPGMNDWACYDTATHDICPDSAWPPPNGQGPTADQHWYVSFPPFPAIVALPFAAIWGTALIDPLLWAIVAALSPTGLFLLLRRLREDGRSGRTVVDDLLLVALYAFGTVFYFVSVQGSVWFAGHVVASVLIPLLLLASLGGQRPLTAGLVMGLLFMTRPSTLFLAVIPLVELLDAARRSDAAPIPEADSAGALRRLAVWVRGVALGRAAKQVVLFALPVAIVGALAMAMNLARFERVTEFGHRFLIIYWRGRIERWGLFNYHYLSKNLAVFTSSLPWLSASEPHLRISRHGLALWFTTPALLLVFVPKRPLDATMRAMALGAALVCIMDLLYQNSGWVQFGYRFACDYLVVVFALIALGGRRLRTPGFVIALLFAVAVNTFGAITFDRAPMFYDDDASQDRLFQPD